MVSSLCVQHEEVAPSSVRTIPRINRMALITHVAAFCSFHRLQVCETRNKLLTSHHHHGHGEDLLPVAGGRDVAEADGGQAGHGEIQRGDVQGVLAGAALPPARAAGVVSVRRADAEGQVVEPAVHIDGVGGLVDDLVVADAVPVEDSVSHQDEEP